MAVQELNEIDVMDDENYFSKKRIHNKKGKLSMIQYINSDKKIYKILFFDDFERLSNMSLYNADTGRETTNITYKADGKTISSIREFDSEGDRLLSITFYKPDGLNVSSIIEYSDDGKETLLTLFGDCGQVEMKVI